MNGDNQGYRAIGPDGTITLFKDLPRRLGEAGHDMHIGDPESRDNGEVTCEAILFTEKRRYTLTAIQPPEGKPSRLWCFVRNRVSSTNPMPQPMFAPERNILGDVDDELTAETFQRIVEAIAANELVVLDTAGARAAPRHGGDFCAEGGMGRPTGMGVVGMVDMPRNRLSQEEEKLLFGLMDRGGVPSGLGSAVADALRRAGG